MNKKISAYLIVGLIAVSAVTAQPTVQLFAAESVTAVPAKSAVVIGNQSVAFEIYNIDGSNYFQLRDLADALNGTESEFNVRFDDTANSVVITPGEGYTTELETVKKGDTMQFGDYAWRVLDVKDGKAFIITEDIIEDHAYHDARGTVVTWQNSSLRAYLNGEFYDSFSTSDKARIAETTVINDDNPYYKDVEGGSNTQDNIFLLSLEEVVTYFGDSGQLGEHWSIDDEYNEARIAEHDGVASWWWLRSPGLGNDRAAGVYAIGFAYLGGYTVNDDHGGVRPALWINL